MQILKSIIKKQQSGTMKKQTTKNHVLTDSK